LSDDQKIDQHLYQLARSRSPLYGLLISIPDLASRREAGLLIDCLVSHQLSMPSVLPSLDSLAALRNGIEAALPDRSCANFIVERFKDWENLAVGEARSAFLDVFPKLAPAARDLGDAGMRGLLAASMEDATVAGCVAAYAMTTAEAVQAMALCAEKAAELNRVELLKAFVTAFPPQKMEESRDGEHLPAALLKVMRVSRAWPATIQLATALAERDISAARGALQDLAGVLAGMPEAKQGRYLDDFRLIVESIGTRAIGYCLRNLKDHYASKDAAAVNRFVSLACQAAAQGGVLAGEAFLKGETDSAREALG
jgi:hypothetical protein